MDPCEGWRRLRYCPGASDPYKSLKTTLKAEIDANAWATLRSEISRPTVFDLHRGARP